MFKIKPAHLRFLAVIIILEVALLLAAIWMTGDFREPRFNIWPVTEWLINYQGGFVRRGLVGELLLRWADPTIGILPNLYRLTLISYLAYVAIFFAIYFLAKIQHFRVLLIALLIQGGIYHMGISADFYTRKENFFLILFGLLCLVYISATRQQMLYKKYLLLGFTSLAMIFGPVMILIHEAYFFMSMPMTALLFWVAYKENPNFIFLRVGFWIYLLVCTLTFLICSMNHGDVALAQTIWDSLPWVDRMKLSPAAPYSQFAAISSVGWKIGQHLSTIYGVLITGGVYWWLLFMLGNGLSLGYLAAQIDPSALSPKPTRFFGLLLIACLISSAMFILAADWGRWIAFISNQLILLMFTLKCSVLAKKSEQSKFILFLLLKIKSIHFKGLFWVLLLYGLVFQMPECCVQYPHLLVFESIFR
jgi:hypothetical protein